MARWHFVWITVGALLGFAALSTPGATRPETVSASATQPSTAETDTEVAGILVNRIADPDCVYPDYCTPVPVCEFDLTRTPHSLGFAPTRDSGGQITGYDTTAADVELQLDFRFTGCHPATTRWRLTSGPDAGESGQARGSEVSDRPTLRCGYDENWSVTELGLRGQYTVEALDGAGNRLPGGLTVLELALTQAECESVIFNDA